MPRTSDARERMIASAAVLQRERGVPGTALPDVLKHSGAPRGSVYHHFPGGRAELAAEATAFAADQLADGLEQLLAERPVLEVLDAFADIWSAVLVGEDFAAGCPVAAGALDFTPDSAARVAAAEGFDRWVTAIEAALRGAGVEAERSTVLATTAIAAFEGAVLLSRAKRSTEPLDAVRVALRELAERELGGV